MANSADSFVRWEGHRDNMTRLLGFLRSHVESKLNMLATGGGGARGAVIYGSFGGSRDCVVAVSLRTMTTGGVSAFFFIGPCGADGPVYRHENAVGRIIEDDPTAVWLLEERLDDIIALVRQVEVWVREQDPIRLDWGPSIGQYLRA